jgi:HK97 family phage portal protein
MKWFNFQKRAITTDTLLADLMADNSVGSGVTVNTTTAQSLPAVICAVNTIAEAVASMPLHVFRRLENGDKQRNTNSIIERLFNLAPNGYQTGYDFKVAMMRSVLLTGNAYAQIIYDNSARPQRLILLNSNCVSVKQLPDFRLGYQVTTEGKVRTLQQEEVLHLRINSDDGIIGKSPITVCRETLGLGIAQADHGAEFFKNSARPSGVLTMDQVLTPDQRTQLRSSLTNLFSTKGNRGNTMLLEGGAKWQAVSMSNQDAEWLESRKFGVAEIARMFKISPIFLMDYSNSTYSNFSEASRAFLTQTLRPLLTNIESVVLTTLVSDRQQLSTNQCRAAENMPPREGGNEYSQSWIQKGQTEATSQQAD